MPKLFLWSTALMRVFGDKLTLASTKQLKSERYNCDSRNLLWTCEKVDFQLHKAPFAENACHHLHEISLLAPFHESLTNVFQVAGVWTLLHRCVNRHINLSRHKGDSNAKVERMRRQVGKTMRSSLRLFHEIYVTHMAHSYSVFLNRTDTHWNFSQSSSCSP